MKKIISKILVVLALVLIVIQFIRPAKNQSPTASENDISVVYPMPEDVRLILAKACNDCHSNNTIYPWYNNIQPIAWWIQNHVKDGKRHLNFNEFAAYRVARQYKKLDECIELIKEDEMPLESYTWIHRNAVLAQNEKSKVIDWCDSLRGIIKSKYPPDSLVMPKRR
jgi:hypothetical protein